MELLYSKTIFVFPKCVTVSRTFAEGELLFVKACNDLYRRLPDGNVYYFSKICHFLMSVKCFKTKMVKIKCSNFYLLMMKIVLN